MLHGPRGPGKLMRCPVIGVLGLLICACLGVPEVVAAAKAPQSRAEALALIGAQKADARIDRLAQLAKQQSKIERRFGIKVLSLKSTAGGYSLELRYAVVEPDYAAPLLNRAHNFMPTAVVNKSGAKLGVPFTQKAGSLRSSVTSAEQIKQGAHYSILFANPGRHVRVGDTVDIVVGDMNLSAIEVI